MPYKFTGLDMALIPRVAWFMCGSMDTKQPTEVKVSDLPPKKDVKGGARYGDGGI